MVGWHHQFNRHEFEQGLGDSEGQGSLTCCSPWGCKELDTTEWLNNKELIAEFLFWNLRVTYPRISLSPRTVSINGLLPKGGRGEGKDQPPCLN